MASTKRLRRSSTDRMIAGVSGGLAEYFDVDPVVVRIAWIAVGILTAVVPAIVLYIVMAIVVPKDSAVGSDSGDGDTASDEASVEPSRENRGPYVFAAILIIIGGVALLANFGLFSWWRWDILWPLILIVIGVAIFAGRLRGD